MAVGKNELTLELGKHFLIIDSNKSFFLEDNQGFRAYRPAGAWQIDCWKLLPEQWHKIYPVYTLKIEWTNSEADKNYIPAINATDLDLGDGIAGVSGQPVNITTPVTVANLPNVIVGEQNTVPVHIETNLQPLEVVNHANNIIDGFKFGNISFTDLYGGQVGFKRLYCKNGKMNLKEDNVTTASLNYDSAYVEIDCHDGIYNVEMFGFEFYDEKSDTIKHSVSYPAIEKGTIYGLYKELD